MWDMTTPDATAIQIGKHVTDAFPSALPVHIHHELMSPLSRADAITFLSVHFNGEATPRQYALERDIWFNPVATIGTWQGILNDIGVETKDGKFVLTDRGSPVAQFDDAASGLMNELAEYVSRNANRPFSRPLPPHR